MIAVSVWTAHVWTAHVINITARRRRGGRRSTEAHEQTDLVPCSDKARPTAPKRGAPQEARQNLACPQKVNVEAPKKAAPALPLRKLLDLCGYAKQRLAETRCGS